MFKPKFFQFIYLVLLICLVLSYSCKMNSHFTSSNKQKVNLYDSLSWITMIDSPGVNYNKMVESFEKFWEHREKPTEADGEGKDIFGRVEPKEEKESNRPIQYVYEYKRFLNWQQRNKNLVKPDGSIMTSEEVLEQWKKSQNDTLNK